MLEPAVGQLDTGGRVLDQLGAAVERVRLHRDESEPDQVAHDLTHRLPGDAGPHRQVGGPGAAAAQSAEDRVVCLLDLRVAALVCRNAPCRPAGLGPLD